MLRLTKPFPDDVGFVKRCRQVMKTAYTEEISSVIELLQGKWTIPILCSMCDRPLRLSELQRAIPSASKKALTSSLRSLEAGRIIVRRDLSSTVLHVEYKLVASMREPLVALLDHLAKWSEFYREHISGSPK
jgi:DNA-binding HxlR family transcriptional regulator